MFDPGYGGFGGAPKFPPHSVLELLLRRGELEMVTPTLDAMAAGGMYDLVGGGFHRYCGRQRWLVPHFEKMLYDNALLVPVYLHGWLVTGEERYREVAEGTVEYMLRDLLLPDGAFASSQDADTDGVEGLTYTWLPGEVGPRSCCSRSSTAASSSAASWTTRSAPSCSRPARSGRSPVSTTRRSRRGTGLRSPRSPRQRAGSTAPTGGTRRGIWASSCSGRSPRTAACTGAIARAARPASGFLDDYANVANGLYELHVATGELRWLEESRRLALLAVELFADDERGGFFLTPVDGEELVVRTKDLDDNPIPSGNSMLAYVLLRLARIYGDDELERHAVSVLRLARDLMARAPTGFGWALCALALHFAPPREIAIVGSPGRRGRSRRARAVRPGRPSSRSARRTPSRSSRARASSTASRPSMSASASPARSL